MRACSRVLGLVLSLFVPLGALAVVAAPANAAVEAVSPTFTCVFEASPTTFTARLGYVNFNDYTTTVPVGATNYFAKDPLATGLSSNQGQPTVFIPGAHPSDFTVTLPKDVPYLWHLLAEEVHVSWAASPRCADAEESVVREPAVVGVPAVGETVTATGERAVLNGGTYDETVEWFRGCDTAEPVSVGTGRTYVIGADALGQRIQAVIDYRDPITGSGVTWETACDSTSLVGEKPDVAATPLLTGSAVTGSVLSLAAPSITGTAPVTTALSWESCDAAGCASVGTDPTYVPVASDVGHSIRAVVTVTNAWGAASRMSAPSTVVTAAPTGAASLGPASLAFTAVAGTTSAARTITFTNGTNADRRISGVTLTGTGFRRAGGDCQARVVLAPGETCAVDVAFAPTTDGAAAGQLTVDAGTPYLVALSGTATRGGRLTTPPSVSFGKVRAHTKVTRSVQVSNTGTQAFSIRSIALSGAQRRDFTLNRRGCAKAVLAPGQACVVKVTLKPRAAGVRRAVLTIGSTAAQPLRAVALAGRGR